MRPRASGGRLCPGGSGPAATLTGTTSRRPSGPAVPAATLVHGPAKLRVPRRPCPRGTRRPGHTAALPGRRHALPSGCRVHSVGPRRVFAAGIRGGFELRAWRLKQQGERRVFAAGQAQRGASGGAAGGAGPQDGAGRDLGRVPCRPAANASDEPRRLTARTRRMPRACATRRRQLSPHGSRHAAATKRAAAAT